MVKGLEVDGRQLLKVLTPTEKARVKLLDSLQFVDLAVRGHYSTVVYDTTQFTELGSALKDQYCLVTAQSSVRVWTKK